MLNVRVDGVPVPQPRPRAAVARDRQGQTVVDPRTGRAKITVWSNSIDVRDWKLLVRSAVSKVWGMPPHEGPIGIYCTFLMPRPKALIWKTKPMPRVLHTKKPDCDNLLKAVWDALLELVWLDDSQVVDCRGTKFICSGDEPPGVEIKIKFFET